MSISAGVPQGSGILGPTLWNVMYNGVLALGLPPGAEVMGFADHIALTVLGESIEEIELLTSVSVSRIESWMQQMRLEITHKKTEFHKWPRQCSQIASRSVMNVLSRYVI